MPLFDALIAAIAGGEDGQGIAEYALIISLIAVVAIVALLFLGGNVSKLISSVGRSI